MVYNGNQKYFSSFNSVRSHLALHKKHEQMSNEMPIKVKANNAKIVREQKWF
jgi:hypothetical protein